jgi:hypothetical protein
MPPVMLDGDNSTGRRIARSVNTSHASGARQRKQFETTVDNGCWIHRTASLASSPPGVTP